MNTSRREMSGITISALSGVTPIPAAISAAFGTLRACVVSAP